MSATRIDIVILTFDPAPQMLEAAVSSVLEHVPERWPDDAEVDVSVRVVDNGGRASTLLSASTWEGRPLAECVTLIVSPINRGFAGGMNIGIEAARAAAAEVIVLLNDDTAVQAGWLEPLLVELGDPLVGAAQPLLVSASDGSINSAGVEIDRFGAGSDRLRSQPVAAAGNEATELAVFTGGAVAFSRAFIDDVGGFDERFFLYYEDVELALRGARLGWRYRLVPASRVVHRGSASTADMGDQVVLLRERNRLWSMAMHGSASAMVSALWLSVRRLRHRPRRVHARALVDGVVGMLPRAASRVRPTLTARRTGRSSQRRAGRVAGTPGVNLVGYHHISSGLGSIAREMSAALQAADIPVIEIDNDLSASPRRRPARPVPEQLHDTTIAIVTAFEFDHFVERFPQLVGPGKRMIAIWLWELEQIPQQHVDASRHVDEVWTPTTFVRDAYRAALGDRVNVRLAPFRMEQPVPSDDAVASWRRGWGDDVVFLVSFDYLSIVERKNPLGAVRAFREAFDGTTSRVRLVIKSINGHARPDDVAQMNDACGDDQRIHVLDEHLDDDQHHGLLAAADVLVSLHRSEGYGLHPALAMSLGTPVIATRYSGVVDFMDDGCAAMIDHELIAVSNGQGIYPDTARWADPDIADAAAQMRRLATDPKLRAELGRRGQQRIQGQPAAAQFGEGYAALLRTPSSGSGPDDEFFDGLDAARSSARNRWKQRVGGRAWPDTARGEGGH